MSRLLRVVACVTAVAALVSAAVVVGLEGAAGGAVPADDETGVHPLVGEFHDTVAGLDWVDHAALRTPMTSSSAGLLPRRRR